MLAWWNKFFPKSDQRARERAIPDNTILEAEVIRSLLCLKPVQIWISLFNNQEKTDKYQSHGPSAPGSTVSSLWSSAEQPGRCGTCWVWSGRCCPAGHPRQLQSSQLRAVIRASWMLAEPASLMPRNTVPWPSSVELMGVWPELLAGPFPGMQRSWPAFL